MIERAAMQVGTHSDSPHGAGETIICFAKGTIVLTPGGERRIESLRHGDLVVTLDSGPMPVRWAGSRSVRASGSLAPIRFARGAMGNDRDLLVSPHHRMLLSRTTPVRPQSDDEILAPAIDLVDNFRITVAYGGMVTYHHLMFDQHQVIIANGAASESFHPGGTALETLEPHARDSLFAALPQIRADVSAYGDASRRCLKIGEARALRAG